MKDSSQKPKNNCIKKHSKSTRKEGIVVDNQVEQIGTQGNQSMGMDSTGKGGSK